MGGIAHNAVKADICEIDRRRFRGADRRNNKSSGTTSTQVLSTKLAIPFQDNQ